MKNFAERLAVLREKVNAAEQTKVSSARETHNGQLPTDAQATNYPQQSAQFVIDFYDWGDWSSWSN